MKKLLLILFLGAVLFLSPELSSAQDNFSRKDFSMLCLHSLAGMKYKMDSLIYEHGFRSGKYDENTPYFFGYYHENRDAYLLVFYKEETSLLNVLIQTSDYQYYKDIRDKLTGPFRLTTESVKFGEFNCKESQSTFAPDGRFLDGINPKENVYLVGWIMDHPKWPRMYQMNTP